MNAATRAVIERLIEASIDSAFKWSATEEESAKLESAIAEARKLLEDDGWIRVEDALPDFNVVVLVCGHVMRSRHSEDGSHDDIWEPYVSEGQRTRCETGEYMESYSESQAEVTHWQPLPQPPKEGK